MNQQQRLVVYPRGTIKKKQACTAGDVVFLLVAGIFGGFCTAGAIVSRPFNSSLIFTFHEFHARPHFPSQLLLLLNQHCMFAFATYTTSQHL